MPRTGVSEISSGIYFSMGRPRGRFGSPVIGISGWAEG